MHVCYHNDYPIITIIYCDFAEATKCSFWKITMDCRDSDIFTL